MMGLPINWLTLPRFSSSFCLQNGDGVSEFVSGDLREHDEGDEKEER